MESALSHKLNHTFLEIKKAILIQNHALAITIMSYSILINKREYIMNCIFI